MHEFWAWISSLKGDAMVAGLAGGFVRWAVHTTSWRDGLAAVFIGGVCATYLADPAADLIAAILKPMGFSGAIKASTAGFVVGLGGVGIAGFLIDAIKGFRFFKSGGRSDG